MSKKETAVVIPTDPENTGIQAVHQLSEQLTVGEEFLLQSLAAEPRSLSAAEWMWHSQRRTQEVLRVETFVEMRDRLLAARVVIEHPPQSGSYRATSLGRCEVINNFSDGPRYLVRRP